MNPPRRPSRSFRPHRRNNEAARTDGHRRLRFERCEDRLTLSGNSAVEIVPLQSQGGFIAFDSGSFLTPPANAFLSAESVIVADGAPIFSLRLGDGLSAPSGSGSGPIVGALHNLPTPAVVTPGDAFDGGTLQGDPPKFSDVFVGEDHDKNFANEFPDAAPGVAMVSPVSGVAGFSGISIGAAISHESVDEVVTNHLGRLFSDLQETLQTVHGDRAKFVERTALPQGESLDGEKSFATIDEGPALLGGMMSPTMDGSQQAISLRRENSTLAEGPPTVSSEGGAIDVAATVAHAQQAYEARMFSAVAAVLDEQGVLDKPASPIEQPLTGELARAVAFELASSQRSAPGMPFKNALDTDGKAPAVPLTHNGPFSELDGESESDRSPALSFAQWPLVVPAAVGGVIITRRRIARKPLCHER